MARSHQPSILDQIETCYEKHHSFNPLPLTGRQYILRRTSQHSTMLANGCGASAPHPGRISMGVSPCQPWGTVYYLAASMWIRDANYSARRSSARFNAIP